MKITFLGTGAAEQYPGVWCDCDYCRQARRLGGRNLRKTSSIHFAQNCLIDFPPSAVYQAERFGIDLLPTQLLLVTHSHEDHFYAHMLYWRYRSESAAALSPQERLMGDCCRHQDLPLLHIYGNRRVFHSVDSILKDRVYNGFSMDVTLVEPYREYQCGKVRFIPMIATHPDREGERGLIYIVETEGKTFLYATDSNTYLPRTRDCISAHRYDAIIMEQTFGYVDKGDSHMTWERAMEEARFFERAKVWKGEPRIFWTHMSPHRTPPHDALEKLLEGTAVTPAYDGMELNL